MRYFVYKVEDLEFVGEATVSHSLHSDHSNALCIVLNRNGKTVEAYNGVADPHGYVDMYGNHNLYMVTDKESNPVYYKVYVNE